MSLTWAERPHRVRDKLLGIYLRHFGKLCVAKMKKGVDLALEWNFLGEFLTVIGDFKLNCRYFLSLVQVCCNYF